jgi:hypothetical protein
MMITRRRWRGIASLDFAPRIVPRAHHPRHFRCPDHGCLTTIEGFSNGDIMCPMHAFAPVLCGALVSPTMRRLGAQGRTFSENRLRNCG